MPVPHSRRPTLALVLGLVLLAAGVLPAAAPAAGAIKPYTLAISPGSVAAGAQATFTATFGNPSDAKQQLGSANLTAPAGFRLVAASASLSGLGSVSVSGSTIALRDLALQPGGSVALTVAADIPCSSGPLTWTVLAKQANGFNGPPGNDLTLTAPSSLTTSVTGQCALRFATQPANARTGEAIAGTAYGIAPPVSVEVVDGAGARVTSSTAPVTIGPGPGSAPGVLGGRRAVDAEVGVAVFPNLTLSAPGLYTLEASSPGLASAVSGVFKVDTVAAFCAEDVLCSRGTSTGTTTVDVTAAPAAGSADAGFLTLSFGAGPALDCDGYVEVSPDTALVDFTSANRAKTATLTIDKKQMTASPNNGASFLEFCFGSPRPFDTKAGPTSPADGAFDWDGDGTPEPVYVGLLPDCADHAAPCVAARNKVGAGDGLIEARIPAGLGDPAMRG